MRKVMLAMIASLALAVAACGPGDEIGPVDPQPPLMPGEAGTPMPGMESPPGGDMTNGAESPSPAP